MTEDELAEIERQYEKYTPIFGIGEAEAHIPALIAEVRRLRDQLVVERAKHNRAWRDECPVTPADLYPEDLAEAREELRAEGFLSPE